MYQGCHGAMVVMQGNSSTSATVATGLVVSGVEAATSSEMPSLTISSRATSAARLGFDWLSRAMISIGVPAAAESSAILAMTKLSASAKAASGPDCGVT